MRFLARMRADMARLMLQAMEGAIAKGTFVWTRKILSHFFMGRTGALEERR